jgi:4-amino-4-deoxy-L-arabinose transferase-like glycosyltransferase
MGTLHRDTQATGGRGWTGLLAAALAALLAFRLAALWMNRTDLFFDEAQYWSWSLEPAFGYYSKPPLVAWVIRLATDSCGMSEFCIRLPSPLIHTATAAVVFLLARRLYDARTGAIAALVFATIPGVSVSAGIISTDVPLLLFWALALLALVHLFETRAWWPALLLGLALGLGLNAKYAMAWLAGCLAVYLVATPERRPILADARLYVALAIAGLLIAPNLAWNEAHSFATFAHTADNAKWSGRIGNPLKALEFVGAQFGVFGPILFASLIIVTWRAWKDGLPAADRLLLAFSLPPIVVIAAQAFLSRAHANWAAVAYVAATVLVTATMIRDLEWRWLKASLWLHVLVVGLVAAATTFAGSLALPDGRDPFARTLGWRAVADATRAELDAARKAGRPFAAVLTDERALTAELLYYMRDEPTPIFAWRDSGRPKDHYELTRAYPKGGPEPVILVSLTAEPTRITQAFQKVEPIATRAVPAGSSEVRRVTFHALAGYDSR